MPKRFGIVKKSDRVEAKRSSCYAYIRIVRYKFFTGVKRPRTKDEALYQTRILLQQILTITTLDIFGMSMIKEELSVKMIS